MNRSKSKDLLGETRKNSSSSIRNFFAPSSPSSRSLVSLIDTENNARKHGSAATNSSSVAKNANVPDYINESGPKISSLPHTFSGTFLSKMFRSTGEFTRSESSSRLSNRDRVSTNTTEEEIPTLSRQARATSIQVFITFHNTRTICKVTEFLTVADIIDIVTTTRKHSTESIVSVHPSSSSPSSTSDKFRMYRLERSTPGCRIWLQPDKQVWGYGINQGDELIINSRDDQAVAMIATPNCAILHRFEYGMEVNVKEVMEIIKGNDIGFTPPLGIRFGIYHTRFGIWLDESKSLWDYEISKDDKLNFSEMTMERIVRISLPEFETKFGLRVLPSMTGEDLTSMIKYQLQNRKLILNPRGHYELFNETSDTWIDLSQPLSSYESSSTKVETLEFRMRHQELVVLTNTDRYVYLVDKSATTNTIVNTVRLEEGFNSPDVHCLFTMSGERLKGEELAWTLLKEFSIRDVLYYRSLKRSLSFLCSTSPEASINAEVHFDLSIDKILPFVCRKFGVLPRDVSSLETDRDSADRKLKLQQTLHACNIKPGSQLLLSVDINSSHTTNLLFMERTKNWNILETENIVQYVVESGKTTKKIASATIDKLIERLSGDGDNEYLEFMSTFFLTYQSFINAQQLLEKLVERYHVPWFPTKTWAEFDAIRNKTQVRICNLLLTWTKKYTSDFIIKKHMGDDLKQKSNQMMKQSFLSDLLTFVETILAEDHPVMSRQIRRNIIKLQENKDRTLYSNAPLPKTNYQNLLSQPKTSCIAQFQAEEIAKYLTHIEYLLFCKIMPSELLNQAWMSSDAQTRARNILTLTKRFNSIACWICKCVVEVKDMKARAKTVTKIIEIAQALHAQNNYSTLMAIIAGLNKAPVIRLKQTFNEINSKTLKKLKDLETLMTAEGSYKNYRTTIQSVQPPCVPYIGVYLLDLTYIEDGNPDNLGNRINFSKRTMVSRVIQQLQQYQENCPPPQTNLNEELIQQLWSIPEASNDYEKLLYAESKKRE